ncbi:MAG: glucose-6-phosphate dehydrogenase assembly protein OpcA, partial [Solirubrobacterales bacterium]
MTTAPLTSSSGVWSARDTTPAEIESALRGLMAERSDEERVHAPARVLNLVVVLDREWKGEISNRLDRVGRSNPARTILVAVEPGRTTIDAWATLVNEPARDSGDISVFRERIEIDVGPHQLGHLETIIYPVLATEVGTVVWSPHGHPEAVDSLIGLADSVLIDSVAESDARTALRRAADLALSADVIDLAWLRPNPWRERIAAAFDPTVWRAALDDIDFVEVRTGPGSNTAALLLLGWLASRLGWQPRQMDFSDEGHPHGLALSGASQVQMRIDLDETMTVPGLSGVTIKTTGDIEVSLDRGAGGLTATRRVGDGEPSQWSVLGASRGEDGILAHGVTHALLPDPIYRPALAAAMTMV